MSGYIITALCIFLLEAILVYTQYKNQLIYLMKNKLILAFCHSLLFSLLYFLTDANSSKTFVIYACYVFLYVSVAERINAKYCVEYYFDTYVKNINIKQLNRYIGLSILLTLITLFIWYL